MIGRLPASRDRRFSTGSKRKSSIACSRSGRSRGFSQLESWLRLQQPSTARERQEIAQILTDLAAYRAEANAIASRTSRDKADVLDVLSTIENASQKLLRLGYAVYRQQRDAQFLPP